MSDVFGAVNLLYIFLGYFEHKGGELSDVCGYGRAGVINFPEAAGFHGQYRCVHRVVYIDVVQLLFAVAENYRIFVF